MPERSKGVDTNPLKFNTVLHLVQGQLVAPYILSQVGMVVVIIYDFKGNLVNIEATNVPIGTVIPD